MICYLDNILVYSKNSAEHKSQVKTVLQKFKEFVLYCKGSKCEFSVPCVNFLEFIISESSIEMKMGKTESIRKWLTLYILGKYRFFYDLLISIADQLSTLVITHVAEDALAELNISFSEQDILISVQLENLQRIL